MKKTMNLMVVLIGTVFALESTICAQTVFADITYTAGGYAKGYGASDCVEAGVAARNQALNDCYSGGHTNCVVEASGSLSWGGRLSNGDDFCNASATVIASDFGGKS